MDIVNIRPGMLRGTVNIPPSKSFAHRAVLAAFLSRGKCRIENVQLSEDIAATVRCAEKMGAVCRYDAVRRILELDGSACADTGGHVKLDCGESGSTLRFLIPVAAALGFDCEFTGRGRLMKRPLDPYFEIFKSRKIRYELKDDTLKTYGSLKPGRFEIDGGLSSQFITGLLFALPQLDGDSEIIIKGRLESRAYVDISIAVLKNFGIKIENRNYESFTVCGGQRFKQRNYRIEGDFSQAAFFLVAGAIGCDITCAGLPEDSLQGDKKIVEIIESTGAAIKREKGGLRAEYRCGMRGVTVDASEIPDLVPILAVLLCFCGGESRIVNAGRLRLKESDRLRAVSSELGHLGADITEGSDYLVIHGRQVLNGTTVSAWNDHRIAMALAVAACRCEGDVGITGARRAVTKSYPEFFEDYADLGGLVK